MHLLQAIGCVALYLLVTISASDVSNHAIAVVEHKTDSGKNDSSICETIIEDIKAAEEKVIAAGKTVERVVEEIINGCECVGPRCGCCNHLEEERIHLNSTVCVNVTYLSKDYGISVTATINQYTIFNETVSVRNPPPICVGAPYVKELGQLCIRFHDLDASAHSLQGCAKVEARLKSVLIAHYELGCFHIGKVSTIPAFVPNVQLVMQKAISSAHSTANYLYKL